jgi:hypothetical protein
MSAATDSNTEPIQVHVRLMDEGTRVFRPAPAKALGTGRARLLAPPDYDPQDEEWEFKPGSVVRIETRQLDGTDAYVAVALAE